MGKGGRTLSFLLTLVLECLHGFFPAVLNYSFLLFHLCFPSVSTGRYPDSRHVLVCSLDFGGMPVPVKL